MAALAVLASFALFGGAEAAFGSEIAKLITELLGLKGAPTEAIGKMIEWVFGSLF